MAFICFPAISVSLSARLNSLQYRRTRAIEQASHIELVRFEQCELLIRQRPPMLNVFVFEEMLVGLDVRWPDDIVKDARRVFPE